MLEKVIEIELMCLFQATNCLPDEREYNDNIQHASPIFRSTALDLNICESEP